MSAAKKLQFNVFEFDDYRQLLKALIEKRKSEGKVFSYRWFAKQAGFSSPNFLKLVIDGERNLSDDSIEKVIRVFHLDKKEGTFFRILVNLSQAKSSELKQELSEQILKLKGFGKAHPLYEQQYRYYSEWYHVAIRELIASENFEENPEWIASQLNPKISPKMANSALALLAELQMIQRDSNGRLQTLHNRVSASHPIVKSSVVTFHKTMIQLGSESLERYATNEREVSSVTTSFSPESLEKAK
ncbi:MAG: TIGR02147 family protein [Pseudobdellovibrionaceae bacterium]